MTDFEKWQEDGIAYGWIMPKSNWLMRLPIIRLIRASYLATQVRRHNKFYRSLGSIPSGYDHWVIWGIVHGKDRSPD